MYREHGPSERRRASAAIHIRRPAAAVYLVVAEAAHGARPPAPPPELRAFAVVAGGRCPKEDAVFHLCVAGVGLVLVHTAQLRHARVGGRVADDLHLVRVRVRG